MEIEKILVSVIVPVYNVQDYIGRCIESLLAQSYANLELLLVNDGTQDDSRKVCEYYQRSDPRIRILDKRNGGLSDARNKGIEEAKGQYLIFVDGDDYVCRNFVSLLLKAAMENSAQVAICSFNIVDDENNILRTEQLKELGPVTDGKRILGEVLTDYGYKYVVAWNKIYQKDIFAKLRFDTGKIYEDEFINFRLFWECGRVALVTEPLYYYVLRSGSITQSSMTENKIKMKCEMHRKRIEFYRVRDAESLYSKACQMYCNWLVECLRRYPDVIAPEYRRRLQGEMRSTVMGAAKHRHFSIKLMAQNLTGFINLRLAANLKSLFMREK